MSSTNPDQLPVKLVRWPAESASRKHCAEIGMLCLLVVERGFPAPVCSDFREDWVRAPISQQDLSVRIAMLRAKAAAYAVPELDPSGILRFRGRSTALSPTETELAAELVRQFGHGTSRETLMKCLPKSSGDSPSNALHLHIMRLRRRIRPLGLVIQTLWNQGYQLGAADSLEASSKSGGSLSPQPAAS